MKQNAKENNSIKKEKIKLGKLIQKQRERQGFSLREVARAVDLPPSNMKYIEDGVNAPSPEKYLSIIQYLAPDNKTLEKLDSTYSIIRGTPPPDVCNIICKNNGMNDALRVIGSQELNPDQIEKLKQLIISFKTEAEKGETEDGKSI